MLKTMMDVKSLLPPPNFGKKVKEADLQSTLHYLTPSGMTLLSRTQQPPPMCGPRGPTVPAKFLFPHKKRHMGHRNAAQFNSAQQEHNRPGERQFCEICEMELQSISDLKLHRSQHESCPTKGCTYRGHPSVMDKHVSAMHTSGIFEKLKKLSTPEEINTWREERRKKYPTVANVQMRQRAEEQRQSRGERIQAIAPRFGKRNDRTRTLKTIPAGSLKSVLPGTATSKPKSKRLNKHQGRSEFKELHGRHMYSKLNDDHDGEIGFPLFKGTSNIKDYQHASTGEKSVSPGALSSLAIYGSDEDDSEEESRTSNKKPSLCQQTAKDQNIDNVECDTSVIVPITREMKKESAVNNHIVSKVNQSTDTSKSSSDEAPEEIPIVHGLSLPPTTQCNMNCTESQIPFVTKREAKPSPKRYKRRLIGLNLRRAHLRKQNTMLEKLLELDIRHERNVLLQCVRFVCENNFFNMGKMPSLAE